MVVLSIYKGADMQTFLPYADFAKSAEGLDNKRLGKQRVETLQIIKALTQPDYGWQNHPAVKMWEGHEDWLFLYNESIIKEILMRGYKNSTYIEFDKIYEDNFLGLESDKPWWLGDEKLHYSHKGRLFEKDPEKYYFYSDYSDYKQLGFTCCETCNYYWPTHMEIA